MKRSMLYILLAIVMLVLASLACTDLPQCAYDCAAGCTLCTGE